MDTGEIYNILSNYEYNDILDIKWMIYDLYENDTNYKLPSLLNKLVNIEDCIKPIKWICIKSFFFIFILILKMT